MKFSDLKANQYREYYERVSGKEILTDEMVGANYRDYCEYWRNRLLPEHLYYMDDDIDTTEYDNKVDEFIRRKNNIIPTLLELVGNITLDEFLKQKSFYRKMVDKHFHCIGKRDGLMGKLFLRMGYVLKLYANNPLSVADMTDLTPDMLYGEETGSKILEWFKGKRDIFNVRYARVKNKADMKQYHKARLSRIPGDLFDELITINNQKFLVGYNYE